MKLIEVPPPLRGHYDGDKLRRVCTTWTRTECVCPNCGSPVMRGSRDGRDYSFACSGCAAVFADVEMSPNNPVRNAGENNLKP